MEGKYLVTNYSRYVQYSSRKSIVLYVFSAAVPTVPVPTYNAKVYILLYNYILNFLFLLFLFFYALFRFRLLSLIYLLSR